MGTRASKLALIQTRSILQQFAKFLPGISFREIHFSTPGDRDQTTDLRQSPSDFFTRDLDEALVEGKLDCAIHSAKDLPDQLSKALDFCWLPWREDPRDALVLAKGRSLSDLPLAPACNPPQADSIAGRPRLGVSSERRADYGRKRFPQAQLLPIRGTIEERLAQLDTGAYDLVIMAGAALRRLGLEDRIAEWIPSAELPAPEGQGVLALTFKAGDPFFLRLRSLFVKAVVFVGAGSGAADSCTIAGLKALERCEVCLHDSLLEKSLLEALPSAAQRFDVGKRCGQHAVRQAEISALIASQARKGYRVVRLKGGDPGLFGRLAEEIEELERLQLPYRVIPGVSSLNAATTGTGMLLTRRGLSRGFCVLTPRLQGGDWGAVTGAQRAKLPVVLFMASNVVQDVAQQMISDGTSADCPAAMVFNAGGDDEIVIRAELGRLAAALADRPERLSGQTDELPGLLIVGEVAGFGFRQDAGALRGKRILLTCSQDLQDQAAAAVCDLGGVPVRRPLIRLTANPTALECVRRLRQYDWLVLTSPAAVRCFREVLNQAGVDLRAVPKLMAAGPGTSREIRKMGLGPEAEASTDFGAGGLLQAARGLINPGAKVLRLRSDKAGNELADALRQMGAVVDDCLLYRNERLTYEALPEFDAVFFASGSAVEAFEELWGREALKGKTILAIGQPTVAVLKRHGLVADLVSPVPTMEASLEALACAFVRKELESLS